MGMDIDPTADDRSDDSRLDRRLGGQSHPHTATAYRRQREPESERGLSEGLKRQGRFVILFRSGRVDEIAPDRFDLISGLIALIGVSIILYRPRG